MSDRNYDHPDDRAIEQAWRQVMATTSRQERGASEPHGQRSGEAADPALVREYTELLGLLPYELAAASPPAQLKEAVMVRAGEASESAAAVASDGAGTPLAPLDAARRDIVPFERPAAGRKTPAPSPAWRYAQAAVLAASLVGVGFLSATVQQQHKQIGQLTGQLQASARSQEDNRTLRNRLEMVTTVARKAYPLRTVSTGRFGASSGNGTAQKPEGIVYVCGMHQQWYLSLHGLEPPAAGGEYHLWFMTEEGKVDGGVLDVRPGAPAEMEAQSMPDGTRGFLVTLEMPDEPESLTILLGESAINL